MADDMVAIPHELIEDIDYHFTCWSKAGDKGNEAHHLIELFNKMSDLKSWHPTYESRTHTLSWERDDLEYG